MKYIIRRIATLFVTMFLVSVVTFFAFNVIPGDPAALILGTQASPQQVATLREQMGLNKSLPARYADWIGGFVHGNFGHSIKYSVSVQSLIADRFPVTVWLTVLSMLLIIAVSIPLGVYSAKKHDTLIDKAINTLTMVSMSIPPFFLGILLILIFGIVLRIFTPGQYVDYKQDFAGFLCYLIWPALSIALPKTATVVKFLRNSVIEQLESDYVRTARSKGNSGNVILYRHVLKNALIPVIALLGMIVADVLAGSIITEQVFGLPGIGRLLIASISARDFPLIQTMVVLIALIVVTINFLVDVAFQMIDPRIRVR